MPPLRPLLTSLAAAFKTAFERLSGSNVFGLIPDPSFFTFARLSLPPSLGCLGDAIGHEVSCFRLRIAIKVHAANGDNRDQTKHRFRAWPLGRWIMLQQVDPNAPDRGP